MTDQRKPCAHCGGNNITIHLNTVYCENCGVECENLTHWNNRPIEDALRARIKQLEAAIKQIRIRTFGDQGVIPEICYSALKDKSHD